MQGTVVLRRVNSITFIRRSQISHVEVNLGGDGIGLVVVPINGGSICMFDPPGDEILMQIYESIVDSDTNVEWHKDANGVWSRIS